MNKNLAYILIKVGLGNLTPIKVESEELNNITIGRGRSINENKIGKWQIYNGEMTMIGYFKNNKPYGEWEYWSGDPNNVNNVPEVVGKGPIDSEYRLTGEHKMFYRDGTESTGTLKEGIRIGRRIIKRLNGIEMGDYINGKKNGIWIVQHITGLIKYIEIQDDEIIGEVVK